jgi:hypothetical protein
MALSLYDISVPVLLGGLRNLSKILEIGRGFAAETGLTEEDLLQARLAPDMFTLTGQVQRATDSAKFVAVRVGGVENVKNEDTETSFEALQQRIRTVTGFIEAVPRSHFDDRADTEISLAAPGGPRLYTPAAYVLEFALPNFFFHVTAAYGVLRHKGAPVGKQDYLGWR